MKQNLKEIENRLSGPMATRKFYKNDCKVEKQVTLKKRLYI